MRFRDADRSKPRVVILWVAFGCVAALSGSALAQLPKLIGTIQGEANTLLGWNIIPVGDQNGDGYDDILVEDWRDYPAPGIYRAKIFLGGLTVDTIPYMVISDSVFGGLSDFGDLNGDGFTDFSVGRWAGASRRAVVYWGGPSNDGSYDLKFGTSANRPIRRGVRGNDIDANGIDELIWPDYTNNCLDLFELAAKPDSVPYMCLKLPNLMAGYSFADLVVAGDLNGDGRTDLATNRMYPQTDSLNGQVYIYFGGPLFDTIPEFIITRPGTFAHNQDLWGERMACLDFNGDGYDDLYIGAEPSQDTTAFFYFGGPVFDTVPDMAILGKADVAAPAGDLNNDGYKDLIRGYPLPFAGDGWVDIFLGGPDADSLRDVRIHNTSIPGLHYEVGRSATGIGDFNGDGIDDFAFDCEGSLNQGIIYIYSGWSGSLDVGYDYDPILPDDFVLTQNYPNPFNATTQIKFGLPEKDQVRLAIYNVLGNEIRVFVDRELSGGTYGIEWDGKDKNGHAVASGVYLYKLTAGKAVRSRKMLLLK